MKTRVTALLVLCVALPGCALVRLPARLVEAAGSGAIRAVTPDAADTADGPVWRELPP